MKTFAVALLLNAIMGIYTEFNDVTRYSLKNEYGAVYDVVTERHKWKPISRILFFIFMFPFSYGVVLIIEILLGFFLPLLAT